MNILVTGASGLVGRQLGQELTRAGHHVRVLSRQSAKRLASRLPFPCVIFQWLGVGPLPEEALENVDVIFNLAGESLAEGRWTQDKKRRLRDSRIQYTQNLNNEIRRIKSGIRLFVGTSAVGFYGDRENEELFENSSQGEGFLAKLCVEWEDAQLSAPADRVVVLRVGMVLASQGGAMQKLLPVFRLGLGGMLGSGRQWMSWIHIEDLVRMYSSVLDSTQVGVMNAVAPEPVTNKTWTKTLGDILKVPTVLAMPQFILKVVLGELSQVLLYSQRVLPRVAMQSDFAFRFPNLYSALQNVCEARKEH